LDLTDCAITNNKAKAAGGGVYLTAGGIFTGCTISGNSATSQTGVGGGIFNSGALTIDQSTISNNLVLRAEAPNHRLLISRGGGILNIHSEMLTIANSIVAGNVSDAAGQTMASDAYFKFGRLFGDFDGSGIVDSADQTIFNQTSRKSSGQAGYLWYADATGSGTGRIASGISRCAFASGAQGCDGPQ